MGEDEFERPPQPVGKLYPDQIAVLCGVCADFLVMDAVPGNWSPATKFAAYRQNNREFLSFWPHSAKCKA
jgi:hypothetical protein